ncbi:unnamed protein product [Closterium sp. NIES-54]
MVTTTTLGGYCVLIFTCTRTSRHLATFTRRPGSSLYTLATEPPRVVASAQVSASGQVASPCSCRLLSHQTLLWHHRLGHPSLPQLRGMHTRLLVSGLPRSLPPLPPSPAPPCLPCIEGRQRAAPHSSSFPPTTAPLQTLHMDVWSPARVSRQGRERYFLLVVDDYTRYTTVFPLRSKGEVVDVLIPWIRTVRLQLCKRFGQDQPVLRLHSDRGGEFSCNLLRDFCRGEGILQSFTLPESPQPNGIAERRIGLVMEVTRTSMIHAAAPHFLWSFAVRYATHQLNLWPRVSLPETSPTLYWTGEFGNVSVFRVWGSRAFVRDTSTDKLSYHAIPCPNTLPMVIVLEKELAALSMRPGDDVKPVLNKIKDTYARMAVAGSNVSQMQQCTKIISVLDNSWDNLIPTLNTQQDRWTPEWLQQQILQEDFRRRHTGGGAANKTAEGYGAAGGSRGRGGGRGRGRGRGFGRGRGRGRGRGFGRGRGRGDYNEGHGSSGGRGSTRMEGACWYCKKAGHPWFKCFSRPQGWAPPSMKLPSGERARGGTVQGSGAQGDGAQGKANPGMFLMVEDVKGSEGDVGSVGKVVMHPLTHWVIDSGCTSHMTPRADLLDEVKSPGKIMFVAAASGALLPVIGVGNAKGPAPSDVSQVDPLLGTEPVKIAVGSGAAPGAASGGAEPEGAGTEGVGSEGAEPEGVEPGGAESEGAESGGAEHGGAASSGGPPGASPQLSPQLLHERLVGCVHHRSGAPGAGGAGDAGLIAGAGGTGGTAAAGLGGARTKGAGAAGTGGVGGARAGDPAEPGAAGAGGSCVGGAGAGGVGAGGARVGGTGAGGVGPVGAGAVGPGAGGAGGTVRPRPYFVPLLQQVLGVPSSTGLTPPLLCPPPDKSHLLLQPTSPLLAPSPYTEQSGGLTKRRGPASRPVSALRTARRAPCSRPHLVPGTHAMALRPSSFPLRVPLPAPPESSLPAVPDPESECAPVDFAAACLLDYTTALVVESASASPPSVGGECALGTDVLEDRQEVFECLAATVPRFASILLAPEGDPDAPDILTPRSYPEAITGPYSSQWQAAMDVEMASWKSTGTYVDEFPPPGANIVDGLWIFRVKRSSGSPPAFKARYVA